MDMLDHLVEDDDIEGRVAKGEGFACGGEHGGGAARAGLAQSRHFDVASERVCAAAAEGAHVLTYAAAEIENAPTIEPSVALDDGEAAVLPSTPDITWIPEACRLRLRLGAQFGGQQRGSGAFKASDA
jgi:hypothetical protein